MSLFQKAENSAAFAKVALLGFAGGGKTRTACYQAIGLVKAARKHKMSYANKPVFFVDTEAGSDYIVDLFAAEKIELQVARTRSFADLIEAMKEAEKNASVFIIDSVSHFWTEFQDAYAKKKNRKRGLEFSDWATVKREWRQSFTEPFLNSNLHIIMCGRATWEYEHFQRDDGKREIAKSGVKMSAEKEMSFEPSLLVFMSHDTDTDGHVTRKATVMKDRFDVLDGREFTNPTFKDFAPHYAKLNWGGKQGGVDSTRTSEGMIEVDVYDERRDARKIKLEEISNMLMKAYSTSRDDKLKRLKALELCFGTNSDTALERATLDDLHRGQMQLAQYLATGKITGEELDDEIPGEPQKPHVSAHDVAPKQAAKTIQ